MTNNSVTFEENLTDLVSSSNNIDRRTISVQHNPRILTPLTRETCHAGQHIIQNDGPGKTINFQSRREFTSSFVSAASVRQIWVSVGALSCKDKRQSTHPWIINTNDGVRKDPGFSRDPTQIPPRSPALLSCGFRDIYVPVFDVGQCNGLYLWNMARISCLSTTIMLQSVFIKYSFYMELFHTHSIESLYNWLSC